MALTRSTKIAEAIIYGGLMVQLVALPLRDNDTLITLTFLLTVAALTFRLIITGLKVKATPMDLPFGLFLAAALASTLYSVNPAETLDEIRADILIPCLTFYLAAWGINDQRRLMGLGRAAVVGLGLLSAYGIIHFFASGGSLTSYVYREASLAEDYHYLGTYLVVAFPLALVVALRAINPWWRWTARMVSLMTPLAVYITFDRGCWVALTLTGLALHPFFIQRLKVYLIGLAATALAIVLLLPSGVLVHGQKIGLYGGQEIEANTLSQRMLVWSYCWRCLKTNPWGGIGYGRHNFAPAFPDFWQRYKKFQLWHCHNTYLDLALQTGLVGLAAFLFLAYRALKMAFSLWRRAGPMAVWGAVGFLSLAAFLVRILWDSFYVDEHVRLVWLVLGLTWTATRLEESPCP